MANRTCVIEGCGSPAYCRGWCCAHYNRWRRHGDPLVSFRSGGWVGVDVPEAERFWEKVDVGHPLGCWEWTGAFTGAGYGLFACEPRKPSGRLSFLGAHRYAFRELRGFLPDGPLDHLCRNRACVNPDHLEPVTPRENTARGVSPWARYDQHKTCPQGHERTPANLYVHPGTGYRACLPCRRERSAAYNRRVSARAEAELAGTGPDRNGR